MRTAASGRSGRSALTAVGHQRSFVTKKTTVALMKGYLAQGSSFKRTALIAIVLVHILAIRFWSPASQHQLPRIRVIARPPMIVRLLTLQSNENASLVRPKKQNQERIDVPVKRHDAKIVPAQPVAITPPAVLIPPILEKNETSGESSHKDVNIAAMIRSAKRNIGKIDRELSGDRPKLYEAKPASLQSRLEKGISGAAKTREDSIEETALPDGRRITKVTRFGMVYCVYKENPAGLTGGRDTMSEGVRDKVTSCPN